MVKRGNTHDDERDVYRPKTPAVGVVKAAPAPTCVPEEIPEVVTGVYHGDELERIRAMRSEQDRLARLEKKDDEHSSDIKGLVSQVGDVRQEIGKLHGVVGELRGELKVLPQLVASIDRALDRSAQREHVTLTAQVDVNRAQQFDAIAAKRTRREWVTIILGGVFSVGVLVEIIRLFS